jgi:hemerythrin
VERSPPSDTALDGKSPIRWSSDYAVGVQEIDQEHQSLFALAEKLQLASRADEGSKILERILDDLVDYTCYHFTHEEELMRRINYPHYQGHCRQHEDLNSKVREMTERAALSETAMTTKVLQFVVDWLKSHTTTSDRRTGTYMRKCEL